MSAIDRLELICAVVVGPHDPFEHRKGHGPTLWVLNAAIEVRSLSWRDSERISYDGGHRAVVCEESARCLIREGARNELSGSDCSRQWISRRGL